ncbi:hypothetical protein [Halomonas elongata]|uniref:hypothetical protein n=1 Tax=Halomonas elongata TaxID=2746 RepID=UPI0040338663
MSNDEHKNKISTKSSRYKNNKPYLVSILAASLPEKSFVHYLTEIPRIRHGKIFILQPNSRLQRPKIALPWIKIMHRIGSRNDFDSLWSWEMSMEAYADKMPSDLS